MITWTEEELEEVWISKEFKDSYRVYCEDNKEQNDFVKFLEGIKLNTKYFRLTTNNKIGQNKRFRNKNVSEDTLTIKEINSLLNKLTDRNVQTINEKITGKLKGKDYLRQLMIDNILHKCVIQPHYNCYYITILIEIYKDTPNINDLIEKNTDQIYQKIKNEEIDSNQSEYMQFCDKNKKLDLLIGHSLLVTELEKYKIIHNKIIPSLNELITIISENTDLNEKYKCVQCLYNIFKSYYGESLLPQGFIDKLNLIVESEKSNKIKFKIMDIIERR
jgi:hypothetical protein